MYDTLIFWIDQPEYIDYLDTEFIVCYNTELLDKEVLQYLINEMIEQGNGLDWLKEILLEDYDSTLKVKDECEQYEYRVDNKNLVQVR